MKQNNLQHGPGFSSEAQGVVGDDAKGFLRAFFADKPPAVKHQLWCHQIHQKAEEALGQTSVAEHSLKLPPAQQPRHILQVMRAPGLGRT